MNNNLSSTKNDTNESDLLNVLLLEDYELDAELVKKEIRSDHPSWRVNHVSDKNAFIKALKEGSPDLVLSDYSLPNFDGLEAFMMVRHMGLEIPFIMVSGELPEEAAIECVKKGVDDYVVKSSLIRLNTAINNVLDKRRIKKENTIISEDLNARKAQYKTIFYDVGVAISEIFIQRETARLLKRTNWDEVTFPDIQEILRSINLHHVNPEMKNLFEAGSTKEMATSFDQVVQENSIEAIKSVFRHLFDNDSTEGEGEFQTLKKNFLFLKAKITCVSRRKGLFILSFIDLTEVKRSENRLTKVLNRLEQTVDVRTTELSTLNSKLQVQANERNKIMEILRTNYINMTDSIIAAKRIQQLILPGKQVIADNFKDVFVYSRPKDIVSGDFHWFFKQNNKCWIAAVDCTGHGVPGAFMSMIGSKILNQIVLENKIESPAEILNELDKYVIQELKQHESGTEISTGMDISLCQVDFNKMQLKYAGAFQECYFFRDGEMQILKGDRHSVGGTFIHEGKNFNETVFDLKNDDSFYILSDGYVDQFGGPKNKKFMKKKFKNMLHDIQGQNMYDQEMRLKNEFQDWKGTQEQVDDILVIGIKI